MPPLYPSVVYLNGEWLDPDQATVSVFDRGFLFGDGIYEVISFYKGQPFLMAEHMDRLKNSLYLSGLKYDTVGLEELVVEMIGRSGLSHEHGVVYLQITRGVAPRTHIYPKAADPTLMMYAKPYPLGQAVGKQVTVWLAKDLRWHRCNIKTISLMGNVQASEAAEKVGAFECILHRSGRITEASHSNFFGVIQGELRTHPADEYILPGIIRAKVLDLAIELNIPVREKAIHISEIPLLQEAFITGTGTEVTAVGMISNADGNLIHFSDLGKHTLSLQIAFRKLTGV